MTDLEKAERARALLDDDVLQNHVIAEIENFALAKFSGSELHDDNSRKEARMMIWAIRQVTARLKDLAATQESAP